MFEIEVEVIRLIPTARRFQSFIVLRSFITFTMPIRSSKTLASTVNHSCAVLGPSTSRSTLTRLPRRHLSTPIPKSSPKPPSPTPSPQTLSPSSRLHRYLPQLTNLSERTNVPIPSLAISFLVLHELTAIVPLVGLYYLLKAFGAGAALMAWIVGMMDSKGTASGDVGNGQEGEDGDTGGRGFLQRKVREWYEEGAKRAERVGKRYGILGYEKEVSQGVDTKDDGDSRDKSLREMQVVRGRGLSEQLANAISAYILVKVCLRLVCCRVYFIADDE